MCAFCRLIKGADAFIPIEKREEFLTRITELFYRGGMFNYSEYDFFGSRFKVLKKAEPENGMDYNYNYFADDFFDGAGLLKSRLCVCSADLGSGEFYNAMLAAYTLEGLYTPGASVISLNGEWFPNPLSTGWINYLFNEKFYMKGIDPWEVYLAIKDTDYASGFSTGSLDFYKQLSISIRGCYDVIAVVDGLDALEKILSAERNDEEDDDLYTWRVNLYKLHSNLCTYIKNYKEKSPLDIEEQVNELTRMLHDYFSVEHVGPFLEETRASGSEALELYKAYLLYDAPACIIKIIADTYDMDFWDVYEKVADVAKRRAFNIKNIDQPLFNVTTQEYFNITSDDLLLYWTKEKPIEFSESLNLWFKALKKEYDDILSKGVDMTRPIRRIQEMLDFGDKHYTHLYFFDTLIYDTLDNITNPEFFALWLVYERLLHDEDNLSASKVLFEPYKWYKDEVDYAEKRHRKCDYWWALGKDEKFNPGRQKVRRFIALLTNKELRKEVFGI